MPIKFFEHQKEAIELLKNGSILCGGVGSGKSRTALAYFYFKICGGKLDSNENLTDIEKPKSLYIITTAKKRDSLDWEREAAFFMISKDPSSSIGNIPLIVDSWNNVNKYKEVKEAFFIFDEQRVIGSGSWVKSFLKIVKANMWILLSATPADTWMDYIPVFLANAFYKNRSDFIRKHVVYNTFTKYPKVDHYVEEAELKRLKDSILVIMDYSKHTIPIYKDLVVPFDREKLKLVEFNRWNPYTNKPIKDVGEYCYIMRKVVNSSPHRLLFIKDLIIKHKKIIVFYNFDYELEILRELKKDPYIYYAEYNGHKHELIPKGESWVYIVQYTSGAEGWNCIETNVVVFYSQNYSYRVTTQAAGRIDRLNTPYKELYYYYLKTNSLIDHSIEKALRTKKNFNEIKMIHF